MSVVVDNLNLSENIVQRTNYLFDIVGFNDTTKVWYANSGSTFASGASTQYNPTQNVTTCSIVTGSGDAVLVNYGANGDKAIKTNGATIIVPIPYYLEDKGISFQIAVVMGSVAISGSNLTSQFEMEINCGRANIVNGTPVSVRAVGSEVYDTIYLNGKYYQGGQGQRITTRNSIISLTNDDDKSKGVGRNNNGYRLRINGKAIANDDSDAPSFPKPIGFNSYLTIKTSNNCVLRLIGVGPNYAFTDLYNKNIDYRGDLTAEKQRDFYIGEYGSYTGSLDGPIKPSLLVSQSTFLNLRTSQSISWSKSDIPGGTEIISGNFNVIESAYCVNLLGRFGFPSENENTSSFRYEAVSGGWYDNNTTESKFIPVSFYQTSSLEVVAGAQSADNRKRIVFATSSFGSGSYLIIPSSSFAPTVYASSSNVNGVSITNNGSIGGILERVQNGSGSTIQIVGTFPSESLQMQLLGNPHQYAGNGTIVGVTGGTSIAIRWDLDVNKMILEVQQIKPTYNKTAKFELTKNTSSLHSITLMYTGSQLRAWQELTEISNTGESLTTFDLFDNLNTSNDYIKFGGNYVKSDYNNGGAYTGKLKGLVIYNRSLTLSELSSSVGFLTSSIL
jgi:hypothetical protein